MSKGDLVEVTMHPDAAGDFVTLYAPEGSAAGSGVRKGRGVVLSVNLTAVTSHSIPAATTVSLTLSPVELPRDPVPSVSILCEDPV